MKPGPAEISASPGPVCCWFCYKCFLMTYRTGVPVRRREFARPSPAPEGSPRKRLRQESFPVTFVYPLPLGRRKWV